jgi:hypothetical protein
MKGTKIEFEVVEIIASIFCFLRNSDRPPLDVTAGILPGRRQITERLLFFPNDGVVHSLSLRIFARSCRSTSLAIF